MKKTKTKTFYFYSKATEIYGQQSNDPRQQSGAQSAAAAAAAAAASAPVGGANVDANATSGAGSGAPTGNVESMEEMLQRAAMHKQMAERDQSPRRSRSRSPTSRG